MYLLRPFGLLDFRLSNPCFADFDWLGVDCANAWTPYVRQEVKTSVKEMRILGISYLVVYCLVISYYC